jgi:hypothetical protein
MFRKFQKHSSIDISGRDGLNPVGRRQPIGTHEDITLASRYECKYLISPMLASSIRQFISPFMRPDPFAINWEGHRYPICSLYLDSEDLHLYQQTVGGEKNRFKLRVRSYSDDPALPVFLEVKHKINTIVKKRRARIPRDQAAALLAGSHPAVPVSMSSGSDIDFFGSHVAMTGAKPLIRVKYQREAYESRGGDPVRVTLDTDVMHSVALSGDFSFAGGRWVTTPVNGLILEIKFTDRFPSWVSDLVRMFELRQQAVPKYILSLDHMLASGREAALAVAGFTLPPRRI